MDELDEAIAASRKRDYKTAFSKYMQLADKMSNPRAQNMIGYMYQNGQGCEPNDEEAIRWYTKAAEQDNPHAQLSLAEMYEDKKDYVLAYFWCMVAAKTDIKTQNGPEGIGEVLNRITEKMNMQERRDASDKYNEWARKRL